MPRKVIITISPVLDHKPSDLPTSGNSRDVGGTTSVRTAGTELLTVPTPYRVIAEAFARIASTENK
jgi:hypothetical protein